MKKLALTLFILFAPLMAHAAIGLDATSTSGNYTGTTNATAITITNTQSNLLLIVTETSWGSTAPTISSVVAGGQTMTKAASKESLGSVSGDSQNYIYYLINPPTGTINVTTTWVGSTAGNMTNISSWYGVDQTTPIEATSTNGGTATGNVTANITTLSSNDVVVDSAFARATSTGWSAGTGQTTLFSYQGSNVSGGSYKLIPTAQTTSTYWVDGKTYWSEVSAALKAVPPPTPTNAALTSAQGTLSVARGTLTIQ